MAFVAVALPALAACQDPCIALAERICNCEPTATTRFSCRAERITSQRGQVKLEESDRELCTQKLETCSCAALDENQLDACGFVPEPEGTDASVD